MVYSIKESTTKYVLCGGRRMSKRMKNLLLANIIMSSFYYKGMSTYYKDKQLQGSAIYIPKRHKFKRRNKR